MNNKKTTAVYINSERCASVTIRRLCLANEIKFMDNTFKSIDIEYLPNGDREFYGKKGATLAESACNILGDQRHNTLLFTSVRNPYSRCVSAYNHAVWRFGGMNNRAGFTFLQFAKLIHSENLLKCMQQPKLWDDPAYPQFENTDLHPYIVQRHGDQLVLKVNKSFIIQWGHCFSYHDQFFKNGKPLVDHFVRVENILDDLNVVFTQLGKEPLSDIRNRNKTVTPGAGGLGYTRADINKQKKFKNTKHYSEYYCDESKRLITEKFKKDIEYFNYTFGD